MVTLTMVTEFFEGSTGANLIDSWAAEIYDRSGGEHSIEVYHPGQLVGPFEVFDAVASHIVDLGWLSHFALPQFEKYSALNYGFETAIGSDASVALYETISGTFFEDNSLEVLAAAYREPSILVSSSASHSQPVNWSGVKSASSSSTAGEFVLDLGGSTTYVSNSELSEALRTGAIDAALIPAELISELNLTDVTSLQLSFPDGTGFSTSFSTLVIDETVRAGLPSDLLDLIDETTGADLSASLGQAYLDAHITALGEIEAANSGYSEASSSQIALWEASYSDFLEVEVDGLSSEAAELRETYLENLERITSNSEPTEQADTLNGTDLADEIDALGGDDTVSGGKGNDTITGGRGEDEIFGGAGSDVIDGGRGADSVFGGAGADTIVSGGGADTVAGGNGRDRVTLGDGNDIFNDSAQSNASGADTVFASAGNDTINGGGGNDKFYGGTGSDLIRGGIGEDTIFAGNGFDTVFGGNGADTVYLGRGNDVFRDSAQNNANGADTVFAGAGADTIVAGGGNNVFSGGNDADTFNFDTSVTLGANQITDFTLGEDVLELEDVAFEDLTFVGTGSGVRVKWDEGSVKLDDVSLGSISEDDFVFV